MSRPSRIAKAPLVWQPKPQPWLRDRDHLSWIGTLPCLSCGRLGASVAAHIRIQTDGAGGRKPSDLYVTPLCGLPRVPSFGGGCHETQHRNGEVTFWADFQARGGSDPWSVAQALYRVSGDMDAGERIIFRARQFLNKTTK